MSMKIANNFFKKKSNIQNIYGIKVFNPKKYEYASIPQVGKMRVNYEYQGLKNAEVTIFLDDKGRGIKEIIDPKREKTYYKNMYGANEVVMVDDLFNRDFMLKQTKNPILKLINKTLGIENSRWVQIPDKMKYKIADELFKSLEL